MRGYRCRLTESQSDLCMMPQTSTVLSLLVLIDLDFTNFASYHSNLRMPAVEFKNLIDFYILYPDHFGKLCFPWCSCHWNRQSHTKWR